jgi:hypothetical protein
VARLYQLCALGERSLADAEEIAAHLGNLGAMTDFSTSLRLQAAKARLPQAALLPRKQKPVPSLRGIRCSASIETTLRCITVSCVQWIVLFAVLQRLLFGAYEEGDVLFEIGDPIDAMCVITARARLRARTTARLHPCVKRASERTN